MTDQVAVSRAVAWLKKRLPAPMAAPETDRLRAARWRIIGALVFVAIVVMALAPLKAIFGVSIVALLIGALAMLAIELPFYLVAKHRADDAWLSDAIEDIRAREAANDA